MQVAAERRAREPRDAAEAATAGHAVARALNFALTLWAPGRILFIRPEPVPTPLQHVAVHVVQPEWVRRLLANRVQTALRVPVVPAHPGEILLPVP